MITTETTPARQVKFGQRVLRRKRRRDGGDKIWIILRVDSFISREGDPLVIFYVLTQDKGDVSYIVDADEPMEVIV